MYTKNECREILRQLSLETGFIYPEKRAKIEKRNYGNEIWNFAPKSKRISISQIIDPINTKEFNKGKMTFAIAHEFGHALFDFVLKNKLDSESVADLTVHDYTKLLKKYYKTPFITTTPKDLIKFQHCIQNNPFLKEKSMRGVLEFDDKYYVASRTSIGIDKLYTNNMVEVFANVFAVQITWDKYKEKDNIDIEFMAGLSDKAKWAIMSLETDRLTKSKDDFVEQICVHIPYRQQKGKTRDMIANEYNYNTLDFENFYKNINATLVKAVETTIKMKHLYPTKQELVEKKIEEQKERQKIENSKKQLKNLAKKDKRITLLEVFEPLPEDKDKFDFLQCNIHNMATYLQGYLESKQYCEVIGVMDSGKIYCFKQPRTIAISEEVLDEYKTFNILKNKKEDVLQINKKENETPLHNNIDKNER
jgi:hypothetical protein